MMKVMKLTDTVVVFILVGILFVLVRFAWVPVWMMKNICFKMCIYRPTLKWFVKSDTQVEVGL